MRPFFLISLLFDYNSLWDMNTVDFDHAGFQLNRVFTNDFYYNAVRDEFGSGSGFDNYRDEERRVFSPADFAPHISPPGSEMDWIEPSFRACDSKAVLRSSEGLERVHGALRLLRTEPLVQACIVYISSRL